MSTILKFYLRTAFNIGVGMCTAFGVFIAVRVALWIIKLVPFVMLIGKMPLVFGIIVATSLASSAVWTGAQWLQGRSFSN